MLTFLTIYFWASLAANAILWAQSLGKEPKITVRNDNVRDEGERLLSQGCGAAIMLPLFALLSLPTTYLQAVGLNDLGLPGYVAWIGFGAGIVTALFLAFRRFSVVNAGMMLPVLSYLIAWHGLQVLSGK